MSSFFDWFLRTATGEAPTEDVNGLADDAIGRRATSPYTPVAGVYQEAYTMNYEEASADAAAPSGIWRQSPPSAPPQVEARGRGPTGEPTARSNRNANSSMTSSIPDFPDTIESHNNEDPNNGDTMAAVKRLCQSKEFNDNLAEADVKLTNNCMRCGHQTRPSELYCHSEMVGGAEVMTLASMGRNWGHCRSCMIHSPRPDPYGRPVDKPWPYPEPLLSVNGFSGNDDEVEVKLAKKYAKVCKTRWAMRGFREKNNATIVRVLRFQDISESIDKDPIHKFSTRQKKWKIAETLKKGGVAIALQFAQMLNTRREKYEAAFSLWQKTLEDRAANTFTKIIVNTIDIKNMTDLLPSLTENIAQYYLCRNLICLTIANAGDWYQELKRNGDTVYHFRCPVCGERYHGWKKEKNKEESYFKATHVLLIDDKSTETPQMIFSDWPENTAEKLIEDCKVIYAADTYKMESGENDAVWKAIRRAREDTSSQWTDTTYTAQTGAAFIKSINDQAGYTKFKPTRALDPNVIFDDTLKFTKAVVNSETVVLGQTDMIRLWACVKNTFLEPGAGISVPP